MGFAMEVISPSRCCTAPEQRDVLARHFLQFTERGSLPCKAVVGVVVGHDGGRADLAQLVLRALQTYPHRMELVLLAVVN